MTDDNTKLRREVQRGADAQALLDNPLLTEALEAFEKEITDQWKKSPLRDVEGREKLRLMLEASAKFSAYIKAAADTGKLAVEQIRQKSAMDRARGWLNSAAWPSN